MSDVAVAKLEITADASSLNKAVETFDKNIDAAKAGVVAFEKQVTETFNSAGKSADKAKESVDEIKKGFEGVKDSVDKNIKNPIKEAAKAVKDNVDSNIKNPIEEAGKSVKLFGTELGSLGKAGGAVAVLIVAFQKLLANISQYIAKSREYAKELKEHNTIVKEINASYNSGVGSAEAFWNALDKVKESTENVNTAFEIAKERMGGALDFLMAKIGSLGAGFLSLLFNVKQSDVALRNMADENKSALDKNVAAQKNYESSLRQIEQITNDIAFLTGDKDGAKAEAELARYNANEAYIRQLNEILDTLRQANNKDYEAIDNVRVRLALQIQLLGKQRESLAVTKDSTDTLTEQQKIDAARARLKTEYNNTLERIATQERQMELDSTSAEKNRERADNMRLDAMIRWRNGLQDIVNEYNLTWGITKNLVDKENELIAAEYKRLGLNYQSEQALRNQETLEESIEKIKEQRKQSMIDYLGLQINAEKNEDKRNALIEEQLNLELELLDMQREKEKKDFKDTEAYKTMLAAGSTIAIDWEKAFDAATEDMRRNIRGVNKELEGANNLKALGTYQNTMNTIYGSMLDAASYFADEEIRVLEEKLEEKQKKLDDDYKETMDRHKKERQAALEQAGFLAATTEETLAAAMSAAEATGDEKIIYEEKRRQEELGINQKYDDLEEKEKQAHEDKTKQLEKETADKIAQINFEQAVSNWGLQMTNHVINTIAGASKTLGELGIFGSAALPLYLAMQAAQLTALIAAYPKKVAAYAKGGIVDSPTVFKFRRGGELQDGIMGEAGAEAIMPLSRMANGDLGVQASGAAQAAGQYTTIENLLGFMVKLYNDGYGDMIEGNRINNK
jgi:hypothetical protein